MDEERDSAISFIHSFIHSSLVGKLNNWEVGEGGGGGGGGVKKTKETHLDFSCAK
jgi:hypothetical protein